MGAHDLNGFDLLDKPVLDYNHARLGIVADVARDPKTNAARHLIVTLDAEARERGGFQRDLLEVPMNLVFGIRRDSVTLDRSLDELRRMATTTEPRRVAEVLQH